MAYGDGGLVDELEDLGDSPVLGRLTWAFPASSLEPPLTVILFPKAGLLGWNEEKKEAEEDGDCGVCAVAFPSKETNMAARGGHGSLGEHSASF